MFSYVCAAHTEYYYAQLRPLVVLTLLLGRMNVPENRSSACVPVSNALFVRLSTSTKSSNALMRGLLWRLIRMRAAAQAALPAGDARVTA
jgi:hypothetical protein